MINFSLKGDDALTAKFKQVSANAAPAIKDSISRAIFRLERDVKTNKLSGAVLKVRTGTLRRSINSAVNETAGGVSGIVSTNVKYGRAHEYGFDGAVSVKAHLRKIKTVFGKPVAEHSIMVGGHSRHVKLPERSFLRSALKEIAPFADADMAKTLKALL